MKKQNSDSPAAMPEARFSFRRQKHTPVGKSYKGLVVNVANLRLRVRFCGSDPRSDFEAALRICERERWRPVFAENVYRQLPEARYYQ